MIRWRCKGVGHIWGHHELYMEIRRSAKNTKIQNAKERQRTQIQNYKKRYQDVERGRSYEATMKYGPKKGCPRESKKLVVGVKHSLDASATSYIQVLSNSSSNFSSDTSRFCATSPAQQISPPPVYISSPNTIGNRSSSINFCHLGHYYSLRLIPISPKYPKEEKTDNKSAVCGLETVPACCGLVWIIIWARLQLLLPLEFGGSGPRQNLPSIL